MVNVKHKKDFMKGSSQETCVYIYILKVGL